MPESKEKNTKLLLCGPPRMEALMLGGRVERIPLIPVSLRFQYDEIPNTLFGILYLEYSILEYSIWNTLFGILVIWNILILY